jgi:NTE family protein
MARIAVVLGAGGITGIAWLLGALEAVQQETGWDPATADVMSGTSAGAVTAAIRCADVPTSRLLEMAEDQDVLDAAIERATGRPPGRRSIPLAWPGSIALGLTGLRATDLRHRAASLVGFVPRGIKPGDEIRGLVHDATRRGWPTQTRLLINACDYGTGQRVTFGSDGGPGARLSDAVVASAAVPGYYQPVRIGERRYVDGGLVSFTNADVVAEHEPDVVLCISPFSSPQADDVLAPLRRATGRQLRREAERLRSAGAHVVVVEPTPEDLGAMGVKVMDRARSRTVYETAVETTTARVQQLLEGVELPGAASPLRLAA